MSTGGPQTIPSNASLATQVRPDFPMLERRINGRPLIYLDSAATTLKPRPVIDAVVRYYTEYTANIHRGLHPLGSEATLHYDDARDSIAAYIGCQSNHVAFVRNATEAINLVAHGHRDSTILYCSGDHHSNLLPWRRCPQATQVAITSDGSLDLHDLENKLRALRPQLLTVTHVSNAFGAINPLNDIVALAHGVGTKVLVDASQAVAHEPIDVAALGCDYLCFSGHKLYGPTGIGVLFATESGWQNLEPANYGGGMVTDVQPDSYTLESVPRRFEAGTPNIEGAIGLAAACEYVEQIGLDRIKTHERALLQHALHRFQELSNVCIRGPLNAQHRGTSVAFEVEGLEAHAAARWLSNRCNILVRSGFHCAQPAHDAIHSRPTVRASFAIYNNVDEIDQLADEVARMSGVVGH